MFVTVEGVKELTGYDVDLATIHMAQAIMESYVGRVEAEVNGANDLALLQKATAYQAAYINTNREMLFEQAAVSQIGQFGQVISFRDNDSPFIAPLAAIACRRLSWKRIRSIKTGSIFYRTPAVDSRWTTE